MENAMQADLMELHSENGVINVWKLERNTRVTLTTRDEHYELIVGTPSRGVVLIASDVRFERQDKAVIAGSRDPQTRIFLPKVIGQGLCVLMRLRNGRTILTKPVLAASVLGSHNSYRFTLWD